MKAVIIGANSYIARNLIYTLKKEKPQCGLRLYGLADVHADGEENYRSMDMLDRKAVSEIDLNCDAIFMFVGKTGSMGGFAAYDSFLDVNERALLNLLDEYRSQQSEAKIIFPSSRLVYKGKKGLLEEDSEKELKTIYAVNKFACEQYLKQYHTVYGVTYCIFRICVPYGTLIPEARSYGTAGFMLDRAERGENIVLYGDGQYRRTITYIGDICANLAAGAFSKKCRNDVYNIGGEDYSLKEMAELIAGKYGVGIDFVEYPEKESRIESGDTVFDASKLEALGIKTTHTFKQWIESGGI